VVFTGTPAAPVFGEHGLKSGDPLSGPLFPVVLEAEAKPATHQIGLQCNFKTQDLTLILFRCGSSGTLVDRVAARVAKLKQENEGK